MTTKEEYKLIIFMASRYIDTLIIRQNQLHNFNAKPIRLSDLNYLKNLLNNTNILEISQTQKNTKPSQEGSSI